MKKALISSLVALAAALPAAPLLAQGADGLRRDADDIANALGAEGASPADGATPLSGAEADEALARASEYLNGMRAVKGRFQQVNSDGSLSEGDFYLQRPGRVRFDYDEPSPLLIVADGRTVASIDSEMDTVDRTLLDETPLAYLLKANIDLADDGQVGGVARQDGLVLISLDDPAGRVGGQLILIFAAPEYALREWVAVDDYGQQTRVILTDVTRQASLDPSLFTYDARVRQGPPR